MPKFVNKPQMTNQSITGTLKQEDSKNNELSNAYRFLVNQKKGSHCIKCI